MLPKTVSYLTILDEFNQNTYGSSRRHVMCECVCDKKVTRRTDYIQKTIKENRICSCGCKHPNKNKCNTSMRHFLSIDEF
jgi:hypothetical protein